MTIRLKPLGANKTELTTDNVVAYFSYNVPVVVYEQHGDGLPKLFVTSKKWSKTTSGHINAFVKSLPGQWEVQHIDQGDLERMVK